MSERWHFTVLDKIHGKNARHSSHILSEWMNNFTNSNDTLYRRDRQTHSRKNNKMWKWYFGRGDETSCHQTDKYTLRKWWAIFTALIGKVCERIGYGLAPFSIKCARWRRKKEPRIIWFQCITPRHRHKKWNEKEISFMRQSYRNFSSSTGNTFICFSLAFSKFSITLRLQLRKCILVSRSLLRMPHQTNKSS